MKKFILILFMIINWQLFIDNCFAQAPNSFSYQAVVRNNSGVAMPNQLVNFRISILQGSANGITVYSETKQLTTSSGGLADFQVGTGTIISGTMAAINWSANTHFLKIELDATGGNAFVLMGTSQLLSVPYALDAKKAESLPIPFIVNENNSNTLLDVTNSGTGFGIKGSNSNTTGFTRGVQGNASSTEGTGVFGIATATTGTTIGVAGLSSSPNGAGVSALNNSTTGPTSGIAASAYSPDGVAGYFNNPATGGHAIVTDEGDVKIGDLSGTGTRMVVADPNGKLNTQTVPNSQWTGNGNYIRNNNSGSVGINTGNYDLTGNPSSLIVNPGNNQYGLLIDGGANNGLSQGAAIRAINTHPNGFVIFSAATGRNAIALAAFADSINSTGVYGRADLASSIGVFGESNEGKGGLFYTVNGTSLQVEVAGANGKAIIVNDGNSGFGEPNPQEKLDINGAVKIGNTTNNNAGTIKFDGSDLKGYVGGQWKSLTGSGTNYTAGSGINISGGNVISSVPQTLSIATNQLTLSNGGGTVTLPSNTYTGGTGIAIAGSTVNALNTNNIWNANKLQGLNLASTTPTNGQALVWNNTSSQWEPQTVSGGSGSSPWTISGNDINNNNTGKVLVGEATGSSNAKFEAAFNNPFGKVASFSNAGAAYMTIVDVAESGTSGNPMACVGCGGSAAIKSTSVYGDALFANATNGRGIFLKGGSASYPAMKIENNVNAITSLEMDGQIKINGGAPGAGKVLTSDANGLATWQTPSGGGGGGAAGWGLTGNSGNSATTNFIGNTDAVDLVMKTNNVEGLVLTSGGAILANGNTTTGTTPAIGSGTRMMWIPNRAAFRAGAVNGTQWNDINIGFNSAAFGNNCIASGMNSFAVGSSSSAGSNTAISMGSSCSATSANTVALGNLVSVNQSGSFCFGDQEFANTMMPSTSNEMNMRFKGGYRLFTTSATSGGSAIGVTLVAGGNSWAQISDVRRKENFVPVNGEDFLNKIAQFKLTSWNYKGQDVKSFRHYGPMAQDFYAAFGKDQLGTIGNDTTITSGDFDGINFIAIQALEKRTSDLNIVNLKLQQENKILLESIEIMKAEMLSQKAELNKKFEILEAILENSKIDKNDFITNK